MNRHLRSSGAITVGPWMVDLNFQPARTGSSLCMTPLPPCPSSEPNEESGGTNRDRVCLICGAELMRELSQESLQRSIIIAMYCESESSNKGVAQWAKRQ